MHHSSIHNHHENLRPSRPDVLTASFDEDDVSSSPQTSPGTRSSSHPLLIFDWDDTILPTSWLEKINAINGKCFLSNHHRRCLDSLCFLIVKNFELASSLGEVIIVTNAARGWVQASCLEFFPSILPMVNKFPIHPRPNDLQVLTWKLEAFDLVSSPKSSTAAAASSATAASRFPSSPSALVSIGDGPMERHAILNLQHRLPIKSIKFKDASTINELMTQHRLLHSRLAEIVQSTESLDLKMNVRGGGGGGGSGGAPPVNTCNIIHISKINSKTINNTLAC